MAIQNRRAITRRNGVTDDHKISSHMSHMSQVQNPNGSDHFRLSQVSSQVVTGLPSVLDRNGRNVAPVQERMSLRTNDLDAGEFERDEVAVGP